MSIYRGVKLYPIIRKAQRLSDEDWTRWLWWPSTNEIVYDALLGGTTSSMGGHDDFAMIAGAVVLKDPETGEEFATGNTVTDYDTKEPFTIVNNNDEEWVRWTQGKRHFKQTLPKGPYVLGSAWVGDPDLDPDTVGISVLPSEWALEEDEDFGQKQVPQDVLESIAAEFGKSKYQVFKVGDWKNPAGHR